ncbi:MAG: TonB-dependent receptor [Candidatus Omnitrophota bacterium]|nr:MAG: TonB-dependent receptor [Candidatus Omnitrophota bacterium]
MFQKRRVIISVLIINALSLNNFCGLALAEEPKGVKSDIIDLEPISITASRIERKLSEVSSSINIISEKEIKDSSAKSVPDLLKDSEGVYMYDSSGVGTAGRINMRGFWGGMSTHQLILIDGIPQNKGTDKLVDWDLIPLGNIERIEILRGPASALYGDNAMSGVINIITKRPSVIPEIKISASGGNYSTWNYKCSISGASKKVGCYLNASRKTTDGFRKHSDYEGNHFGGKLDFLIDKVQNLRLSLDYHEKERGAHPWAIKDTQIEEDRRQARPGSENDKSEAEKINMDITYHRDISEASRFETTFYYRYEDSESFYTSGSKTTSTKEQLEDEDSYGLLLRLNTNPEVFGMKHSLTAGVDLEKNDVDYQEYAAPYQVRGDIRKDYNIERYKIGPYIQDEIKLFDPLKFIAGIRYDLITFDFTNCEDENNSSKKQMSEITPKCALSYAYQKKSNIYTNYAKAFRTPTIGQLFTYGSSSDSDLNPEEATNYEVGVHHRFNDNLKTNVCLYWMRLDNEIWYDSADKKYKNYGKTTHKGIEARLDYKIIEELSGFVNYAYTGAKNESDEYKGNYLTNIPIHKGSLGLRLETDFGLRINLIASKVGASYIDSANDDKLSDFLTIDTKIDYKHKRWSIFLAIDNLLNEEYNSYGYKTSAQLKYFNPAPKRTFTFGIGLEF